MRKLLLLAAVTSCFAAPAFAATPAYKSVVIGGPNTQGAALNNVGHVIFNTNPYSSNSAASFFNGSQTTTLGTLGSAYSFATAINNMDQVVGRVGTGINGAAHAFLYKNGAMSDLGTLGGKTSQAIGINDSGMVVGTSSNSSNIDRAFTYTQAGGMKDLGTLGGASSSATGINAKGDIIGYSDTATERSHPFLYSNGVMTDLSTVMQLGTVMTEQGFIQQTSIGALNFTNDGSIVGYRRITVSDPSGMPLVSDDVGYVFSNNQLQSTGTSLVSDINARGTQIVQPYFGDSYAVINGVSYNMNALVGNVAPGPGINFGNAYAVNEGNQILAQGWRSGGATYTILLSAVPEPEAFAMLLAGLALVGVAARRKARSAV